MGGHGEGEAPLAPPPQEPLFDLALDKMQPVVARASEPHGPYAEWVVVDRDPLAHHGIELDLCGLDKGREVLVLVEPRETEAQARVDVERELEQQKPYGQELEARVDGGAVDGVEGGHCDVIRPLRALKTVAVLSGVDARHVSNIMCTLDTVS